MTIFDRRLARKNQAGDVYAAHLVDVVQRHLDHPHHRDYANALCRGQRLYRQHAALWHRLITLREATR